MATLAKSWMGMLFQALNGDYWTQILYKICLYSVQMLAVTQYTFIFLYT